MKKIYLAFLISLLSFSQAHTKENNFSLNDAEQKYLQNKKTIKMCVDPDWMPFEKIENNVHIGIAHDYIKIISETLNIPITLVNTNSWTQSIEKAKKRECDIYSIISITPERAKYMNFTQPFISVSTVIATNASEMFINDITEVLDKTFAVVEGYSIGYFLKQKYPNIKIVTVKSLTDGLHAVETGNVFGYIDSLPIINYRLHKEYLGILSITGRINIDIPYRIATRKDEPILNTIFEKALQNISANERQIIYNTWVNSVAKSKE
ncbi:transporter substrate-binding domain-containing protein [Sulfurimonas sp. SAG-AH-194-I05]|nr:transporter substrate-binding domain-containing protein [Sulfurimonas sp. SAG-AH-194-I05]MDF1875494.1 transporter substrate-binding domain-containing protein [Sulfurimonas sp. SAG-AH-194-I05]